MSRDASAFGRRVVLLSGDRLASPAAWTAELDGAVPRGEAQMVGALLLDFRSQSYAPSAEDAGRLVDSLLARFGAVVPPVATVARSGPQFGGTRVLCSVVEMRGCRAAAFPSEAEAWLWLRAQLRLPVAGLTAAEQGGAAADGTMGA